jgi:hypothetical protein
MNLMKLAIKFVAAARTAACLAVLVAPLCTALGQGSLTPVAPPAPTMKTLAQIEARTPISSAPFTISQSGSYYLTNDLAVSSGDAITIAANNVALDLNGFTISSTAAAATGFGIVLSGGPKNLAIHNGFIQSGVTNTGGVYSGPGFFNGIAYNNGIPPVNVRVTNVGVTGCRVSGILVGFDSTVVEFCTVRTTGGVGILGSTVKNCTAKDCGTGAIQGEQVSDSRGESSSSGSGISGYTVLNCYGTSNNSDPGIGAYTAKNCVGSSLSGKGINGILAESCYGNGGEAGISMYTAQNCYGIGSSGAGIYTEGTASNCYGVSSSGAGISASTAENCYGHTNGDAAGVLAISAQNCRGYSAIGRGVSAETAANCHGVSAGGPGGAGIYADMAQGCRGSSNNGTGISATTALNCTGYTGNYYAIFSIDAQNCYAYATAGGIGLYAQRTAQNCYGSGAYGIQAGYSQGGVATNCHGVSTGNGHGLQADIATGCYGSSPNGNGVLAIIANCCRGFGSPIGVSANFKYNMP